ncbi:hypothetical protein C8R44DRAFT_751599 [Mycena epipterygia]|nr:hypothetical protein C8R44DRAFT_751599 [Mycena epipterygia]
MGYLMPEAAAMGGTPSPYGSYATLPAQYSSPYMPGTFMNEPGCKIFAPDICSDLGRRNGLVDIQVCIRDGGMTSRGLRDKASQGYRCLLYKSPGEHPASNQDEVDEVCQTVVLVLFPHRHRRKVASLFAPLRTSTSTGSSTTLHSYPAVYKPFRPPAFANGMPPCAHVLQSGGLQHEPLLTTTPSSGLKSPAPDGSLYNLSSIRTSVASNANASVKFNSRVWTQAINLRYTTWLQTRLSPFNFQTLPCICCLKREHKCQNHTQESALKLSLFSTPPDFGRSSLPSSFNPSFQVVLYPSFRYQITSLFACQGAKGPVPMGGVTQQSGEEKSQMGPRGGAIHSNDKEKAG